MVFIYYSLIITTRRRSQYCIQLDGAGLRSRVDHSKGKRKVKIPSGTKSTQESAISQRQGPEMPIIFAPHLGLNQTDPNHIQRAQINIHEPVQTVLHHVQGKGLGNAAKTLSRSDEFLSYPGKFPERGGNSGILQGMEITIIQTPNQKYQGLSSQKEEGNQERSPSSFYCLASSQPITPRREE
ncbi:hypothetical protein O181_081056 [Austropuccinia psidii MF-1]|uniref:Uncharacterized protein n=1 Tax=Austropuccinia psidii MF-1 TaxID=1389203 RepID=A0A9Q3FPZ1_9BASI|nr:hypothetical protein [Austropuccinia psidii MF-1]